jgi:hypothetical protein
VAHTTILVIEEYLDLSGVTVELLRYLRTIEVISPAVEKYSDSIRFNCELHHLHMLGWTLE